MLSAIKSRMACFTVLRDKVNQWVITEFDVNWLVNTLINFILWQKTLMPYECSNCTVKFQAPMQSSARFTIIVRVIKFYL